MKLVPVAVLLAPWLILFIYLFIEQKTFSSFLLYQPMSGMSEVFLARLWPSQYHYGSPKRIWLFLLACNSLGGHVWVQTSRWASCFPFLSSFTLNANLHLNGGPRVHSIDIYSIRVAISVLLTEFWWWLMAKHEANSYTPVMQCTSTSAAIPSLAK